MSPHLPDIPATRLDIVVADSSPPGHLTVVLAGELDADEATHLHTTLSAALARYAPTRVRLDAAELTFIDSGGVRTLLRCRELAEQAGARLSTENVHPNAYQVLEITGLLEILRVTPALG